MAKKIDFEPFEPIKLSEREKAGRAFMEVVHGAFEVGYQAGVADTLKKQESKK